MDTKFQRWITNNQPKDGMLYKNGFKEECLFWRDDIIPMFNNVERTFEEYDKIAGDIDSYTEIVGTHFSKSIRHPVLKITYKNTVVVFRYNFYDYEIAVVGDNNLVIPMKGLFRSIDTNFYYQGFPEEYQLSERYETNKCKFMAKLGNHYQFYTFMFLLKTELDNHLTRLMWLT